MKPVIALSLVVLVGLAALGFVSSDITGDVTRPPRPVLRPAPKPIVRAPTIEKTYVVDTQPEYAYDNTAVYQLQRDVCILAKTIAVQGTTPELNAIMQRYGCAG